MKGIQKQVKEKKKKEPIYIHSFNQIMGCGQNWADLYRCPVEDDIHWGEKDPSDAFKLVGDMKLRRK